MLIYDSVFLFNTKLISRCVLQVYYTKEVEGNEESKKERSTRSSIAVRGYKSSSMNDTTA